MIVIITPLVVKYVYLVCFGEKDKTRTPYWACANLTTAKDMAERHFGVRPTQARTAHLWRAESIAEPGYMVEIRRLRIQGQA